MEAILTIFCLIHSNFVSNKITRKSFSKIAYFKCVFFSAYDPMESHTFFFEI